MSTLPRPWPARTFGRAYCAVQLGRHRCTELWSSQAVGSAAVSTAETIHALEYYSRMAAAVRSDQPHLFPQGPDDADAAVPQPWAHARLARAQGSEARLHAPLCRSDGPYRQAAQMRLVLTSAAARLNASEILMDDSFFQE